MHFKNLLSRILVCIIFLMGATAAFAQNKVITGKITDSKDGSPLIGVAVGAKGGAAGASTGVDGSYRISVPESVTTLVFRYIGYTTKEEVIGTRTNISITMVSTTESLNEVVVVGYGTQRVKDATGAVASLNPKDFNKGVIATPEQLLQGRIAGVQVTPASGEPGSSATINIRGTGSIRSGNNPLYVVDGVPLDGGGTSGGLDNGAGSSSARNPLAFLNPNDIENISILKDASASAIYGSRGANGVVLITTKKGAANKGIQFTANTSISNVAKQYSLLNASEFLQAVQAVGSNAGTLAEGGINYGGNTDWQKEIFRTGVSQNYNLGFGGAKNTSSYRASIGYDEQNGTVKTTGLKRLTGRLNGTKTLFKDKLKLDLTFLASNVKNTYAPISDNAGFEGNLIGAVLQANPTIPVRDETGRYFAQGTFRNPTASLDLIDDTDNINRYLGNLSATLTLAKNLSYKATYGLDNSKSVRETYMDPNLPGYNGAPSRIRERDVAAVTGNGRAVIQNLKLQSQITEHTLNYDAKMNNNSLSALLGYSYQQFKNFGFNNVAWGTLTPGVLRNDINQFQNQLPLFGDSTKSELQSFFTRVNYSINDKYLFTGTVRVDGSSKFGTNNKYATFPAFAFKWKIMNEDFGPKKLFSDLSLRLNFGITGNQEFPAYASLAIKQTQFNGSTPTITAASPDLKWETTTQYGAGIDFAIVGNRLSGTIDYFNKAGKDLLFLQDNAQPAADPRRWVNLPGINRNTGVEVGLNYIAVQKTKFSWDLAYNMTFIKNRIEDFGNRNIITGNINGQGLSGAFAQTFTNGFPLSTFRVAEFAGYDSQGLAIYPNGDLGVLQGSALPTFTAGLTNNFTFGRFNASFFLNAATGFFIYNNTANAFFIKGNLVTGRNVTTDVANSVENPLNSGEVSTRFLEKGDFLRLSNATLGYTFPLTNAKAIKTLRVNVSGQNLFLITNYSGLDPEINTNKERNGVPSRGIDYTSYPSARTFTLGLNLGF